MGELMGYVDQITSYGFSSTDLGNKAPEQLPLLDEPRALCNTRAAAFRM